MAASNRYPLSTADGKSIPLDVVRPHSLLALAFTAASGTGSLEVPTGLELLTVFSTEDCIMQFFLASTAATALVAGTPKSDCLYIPAGTVVVVSPPVDRRFYSVIGIAASGELKIQFLSNWNGLTLQSQINRR